MTSAFDLPVGSFMRSALISVSPSATVAEIATILERHDISAVPVIESGRLRGIVSMTDLLRPGSDESAPRLAADILQTPVITVPSDAPLRTAARAMVDHRIHRVMVRDGERVLGLLSTRDAMRALVEERVTAPVGCVTSSPVLALDLGDSIETAIARLEQANIRGLVVLDGDWPVGVFTQTEALHARSLPSSLRAGPLENVMSYETVCMDVATPLYRVARQARALRVRRILVVEHKRLFGIASGFDLMRWIAET